MASRGVAIALISSTLTRYLPLGSCMWWIRPLLTQSAMVFRLIFALRFSRRMRSASRADTHSYSKGSVLVASLMLMTLHPNPPKCQNCFEAVSTLPACPLFACAIVRDVTAPTVASATEDVTVWGAWSYDPATPALYMTHPCNPVTEYWVPLPRHLDHETAERLSSQWRTHLAGKVWATKEVLGSLDAALTALTSTPRP